MQTPYFIFDETSFSTNIGNFKKALNVHFNKSEIAYSVKTNSLPYIIKKAFSTGMMIEISSFDEFALAKELQIPINRIVYNGPYKDKNSFIEAVNCGAIVNIECSREIQWLNECKKNANVGIRINVDLKKISPEDAKENEPLSRFGFNYENKTLKNAISQIVEKNIMVSGISVHKTSRTRSKEVYYNMAKYISDILNDLKLNIDYIDIGGGFYGGGGDSLKPSYFDYSTAIFYGLGKWHNRKIIVEPGSASIAAPVQFEMSVIDTKTINHEKYCCVDGSRLDIDPFFHKQSYDYKIGYSVGERRIISKQYITGPTCLESDVLFSIDNEKELYIGDHITIYKVGAYTMTLTPNFIKMIPAVYARKKNQMIEARRRWTIKDYLQGNLK